MAHPFTREKVSAHNWSCFSRSHCSGLSVLTQAAYLAAYHRFSSRSYCPCTSADKMVWYKCSLTHVSEEYRLTFTSPLNSYNNTEDRIVWGACTHLLLLLAWCRLGGHKQEHLKLWQVKLQELLLNSLETLHGK